MRFASIVKNNILICANVLYLELALKEYVLDGEECHQNIVNKMHNNY